jgi:hypothetical protein
MLESLVMTQQFGIAAAVLAHLPELHNDAMLLSYARRACEAASSHVPHHLAFALLPLLCLPACWQGGRMHLYPNLPS